MKGRQPFGWWHRSRSAMMRYRFKLTYLGKSPLGLVLSCSYSCSLPTFCWASGGTPTTVGSSAASRIPVLTCLARGVLVPDWAEPATGGYRVG